MSYVRPTIATAKVSSRFGPRIDPVTGKAGASHGGMDFAVPSGTPVFATAAGKVATAAVDEEGGNYIILQHDDGKKSAYLHLTSFLVKSGDRVAAGQHIAQSGNTGKRTTGPHLHFEVREPAKPKDTRLDPLKYLPFKFDLTSGGSITGGGIGLGALAVAGGIAFLVWRKRRK